MINNTPNRRIMKKNIFNKSHFFSALTLCGALSGFISNADATIRVDLDMSGRSNDEVSDPDYIAWAANESNKSLTVEGITFTLSNTSSSGELSSTWYKVGVQSPNYARMVCDGAYIKDGDSSSGLKLTITGLSDGNHNLLTYHNAVDDYSTTTLCDMDIYVNGKKTTTITPTKRSIVTSETQTAYTTFSGTSVSIQFMPNTSKSCDSYKVYLNGFALDVPNSTKQAQNPDPANHDEHVAADNGTYTLNWQAASNAAKHNIYFGTDSASVANSTNAKQQTGTSYSVKDLNNLKTYWWRVDEVDADGTVTKGDMWSFKPRHLAFPEAEGYGKYAIGGRGGKVVHVTNLNDDGEGSLRWAMAELDYPRTIVFDVAGVIELKSRLTQKGTHVTIAGQTAPGKGICVKAAPVGVGSESICRDFRVRLGSGDTYDGLGMAGAQYSITDHCSVSWTIDEAFSCRNAKNMTLQRTLISEALNIAGHKNYPAGTGHGYAATVGGDIASLHHNFLAHNQGRNWSMGGGLDGNGYYAGRLDIFNNVVYNWWHRVCDGGAHEVNFVGNYYKRGAASEASNMDYCLKADLEGAGKGSQAYYYHNNIMAHQKKSDGYVFDGTDDTKGRTYTLSNGQVLDWTLWNSKPFFESQATIESSRNAYKSVLSDVGCNMPAIDAHDARMVTETLNGTYSCTGAQSKVGGIIDASSESKESWSEYTTVYREANWDSDGDGMPNWWEEFHGFNPNGAKGNFDESNADSNGDGYTNLEDYLDWMATPHYETQAGTAITIDVKEYFRGFTGTNTYSATPSNSSCTTTISGSSLTVTPAQKGIFYVKVTVKDNEGDSFTRRIGIKADGVSDPAKLIKHGAGSSSQTLKKDSTLADFCFEWLNASSVSVEGLPNGIITTIDKEQRSVCFSGFANDTVGRYRYSVSTIGGVTDTVRYGTIIIEECESTASILIEGEKGVVIYPNPMAASCTLQLTTHPYVEVEWNISDIFGRQYRKGNIKADETGNIEIIIERGNLESGIYLVNVKERENNGTDRKIKLIIR